MTILLYYTAALEGDLMQWVTAVKSQQTGNILLEHTWGGGGGRGPGGLVEGR